MSTDSAAESEEPTQPAERHWRLIIILGGVAVVWAASWYLITRNLEGEDKRGQFGDMFGAVNSLFSGLAFGCLVYAIFLQHRALALQQQELRLQRKELALQRQELQLSREEFAAQTKVLSQQQQTMQDTYTHQVRQARAAFEPIFIPTRFEYADSFTHYYFDNTGGRALNLGIELLEPFATQVKEKAIEASISTPVRRDERQVLEVRFDHRGALAVFPVLFAITYETQDAQSGRKEFRCEQRQRPKLM